MDILIVLFTIQAGFKMLQDLPNKRMQSFMKAVWSRSTGLVNSTELCRKQKCFDGFSDDIRDYVNLFTLIFQVISNSCPTGIIAFRYCTSVSHSWREMAVPALLIHGSGRGRVPGGWRTKRQVWGSSEEGRAGVTYLQAGGAESDCPLVQGLNLLNNLKDGDRYEWNRHLWLNGEPVLAQLSEVYGCQGDSQGVCQLAHWPWIWSHQCALTVQNNQLCQFLQRNSHANHR